MRHNGLKGRALVHESPGFVLGTAQLELAGRNPNHLVRKGEILPRKPENCRFFTGLGEGKGRFWQFFYRKSVNRFPKILFNSRAVRFPNTAKPLFGNSEAEIDRPPP